MKMYLIKKKNQILNDVHSYPALPFSESHINRETNTGYSGDIWIDETVKKWGDANGVNVMCELHRRCEYHDRNIVLMLK